MLDVLGSAAIGMGRWTEAGHPFSSPEHLADILQILWDFDAHFYKPDAPNNKVKDATVLEPLCWAFLSFFPERFIVQEINCNADGDTGQVQMLALLMYYFALASATAYCHRNSGLSRLLSLKGADSNSESLPTVATIKGRVRPNLLLPSVCCMHAWHWLSPIIINLKSLRSTGSKFTICAAHDHRGISQCRRGGRFL